MREERNLVMGPLAGDATQLRILAACDNYTPSSSGGAEKAAHELYRRIASRVTPIEVLTFAHDRAYVDPNVDVRRVRGLDLSRIVGGYFALTPSVFPESWRCFRSFKPTVLHAHTIHYNGCAALAHLASKTGLPLVLTAQLGPLGEVPLLPRLAGTAYDRSVGRYIVRRAHTILAVSESVRAHMVDLGADPEKVIIVENGVDHDRFSCGALQETDNPLVLTVGRMIANKGPQLLVEAAIDLMRRGRRFRLTLLGDGPLRPTLQRAVEEAGLEEQITFAGHVADVEQWLAKAEVVVRPSFTEGLPLAVLEAMAAGRCNIVSDIPANRELVTNDENGLTFRTGDATDLARVLDRAVTEPGLRRRLGSVAEISSKSRSWDRMADETRAALAAASRGI